MMIGRLLAITMVGLAAVGCATVRGASDYDREVSFEELHTYDWLDAPEGAREALEAVSPFLERRLQRSVERELLERGFARRSEGEVDFYVTAYVIAVAEEDAPESPAYGAVSVVSFGIGFGYPYRFASPYRCCGFRYPFWGFPYVSYPFYDYPYGYWYPSFAAGYLSPRVYERVDGYLPGTLVVDIVDARAEELIWRGWADGALIYAPDSEDLPAFIDDTVRKIMRTFPPEGSG